MGRRFASHSLKTEHYWPDVYIALFFNKQNIIRTFLLTKRFGNTKMTMKQDFETIRLAHIPRL